MSFYLFVFLKCSVKYLGPILQDRITLSDILPNSSLPLIVRGPDLVLNKGREEIGRSSLFLLHDHVRVMIPEFSDK